MNTKMLKVMLLQLLVNSSVLAKQDFIKQLDSHSAIWINVGNIFTTTSYAHLHIPIKVEDLKRRQAFMKSIDQRF